MSNYLRAPRFFCLVVCTCVICASFFDSASTAGQEEADKRIRVGIYNNYPVVYEKGGQPTGFQLEILKEAARREGWIISYFFYSSLKNVIESLETGTIDLGLGIEPTEERRQFLDFTTEKNALQTGQIFVGAGGKNIQNMSDLGGKRVAILSQSIAGEYMADTCERLKTGTLLRRVNSYEEIAEAVATGVVDAGLLNEYHRQIFTNLYQLRPTPVVFKSTEVQYAVPKNQNRFLIDRLDRYMRAGKITTRSPYQQIEQKFFPNLPIASEGLGRRQIIIAVAICLLLVIATSMVGAVLPNFSKESTLASFAREDIRYVFKLVSTTTVSFWFLDSFVAWIVFNDVQKLTLLEWLLTDVPAENLYIRAGLFLVSAVFGLFLLKHVHKYQRVIDVLIISLNRFEQLTDNARDMIFRMSLPTGEYEFVSKASLDIFGYSPTEFYQRPLLIREMVHQDWKTYFSEQWEDLLSGKAPLCYEFQVITKGGQTRWINQRNTVYCNESGKPYALEGIVTDVTAQRCSATGATDVHLAARA